MRKPNFRTSDWKIQSAIRTASMDHNAKIALSPPRSTTYDTLINPSALHLNHFLRAAQARYLHPRGYPARRASHQPANVTLANRARATLSVLPECHPQYSHIRALFPRTAATIRSKAHRHPAPHAGPLKVHQNA